MILIIDNHDSFVFNLARYVSELGFDAIVKRNDALTIEEIEETLKPTHIILSPGPCTPNEAGVCLDIVDHFKSHIPILGVCLGHQVIGQACGGKIVSAFVPTHGKATPITHNHTGLFQALPNPLLVGRYHSLVVSTEEFPACLSINAWSAEGEIMALQHTQYALYGVQFHPESVLTEYGHTVLQQFLEVSSVGLDAKPGGTALYQPHQTVP